MKKAEKNDWIFMGLVLLAIVIQVPISYVVDCFVPSEYAAVVFIAIMFNVLFALACAGLFLYRTPER